MALNQISQQHTSLTKVAIGWLLAVFALLSAQLALANAPPTIDSIAAGPGQAVVTFTPGLANESSPITGYRYVKDDGTVIPFHPQRISRRLQSQWMLPAMSIRLTTRRALPVALWRRPPPTAP